MSTSRETATPRKAGASRLFGSTTNGTPRTPWTPWTARCWTGGSCGSRWPGTADPPTPITAEDGEEEDRAGGTADGGAEAVPPARDAGDGADPAAGAVHLLEAGPATADPGPGPTPGPSPALPGPRRPRRALLPGLGPGPDPDPGPGPEAAPLPPREGPGRDLKASQSQQQKMEMKPRRVSVKDV